MLHNRPGPASSPPFDFFKPGYNCWRVESANYASVLVDCANYYRDLHESICKAKKSIFMLGWDIDSRISLLRGEAAQQSQCPVNLYELLQKKAQQNPAMQIYLNKWDYSLIFIAEREPLPALKWKNQPSENIHFCVDGSIPLGACHHQKVIVIDDEVAFCGGMDVAMGRWDDRGHAHLNEERADPGGLHKYKTEAPFGPYHDIQMVVAGPVVKALAQLVRDRWVAASDVEPLPIITQVPAGLPHAWPDSDPPDFENVDIAVARTLPPYKDSPGVYEIESMYLDEICRAEKFIYIENQYLVRTEIAQALNKRMKEKPDLRVLLVSTENPSGIFEEKAMWTGRLEFAKILKEGGVRDRAVMAYPASCENGQDMPIHIHSKVMMVDDKFLHIGSSNLNGRSMGLDTECDLILRGNDEKSCLKIASVRNDLIREHSGQEVADIQRMVDEGNKAIDFLKIVETSHQHLYEMDDKKYEDKILGDAVRKFADPDTPFFGESLNFLRGKAESDSGKIDNIFVILGAILFMAAACLLVWKITPLSDYASPESLADIFSQVKESSWGIPAVLAFFVIGGLFFFPVTVLIAATAIVFGPMIGFVLSLIGSMASASVGFLAGRAMEKNLAHSTTGNRVFDKIKNAVHNAGILGVGFMRMVPVAPFSLVNIGMGMAKISWTVYILGTLVGLLPGIVVLSFLGDSLMKVWKHPSVENITYLSGGVVVWLALTIIFHCLEKYFSKQKYEHEMA